MKISPEQYASAHGIPARRVRYMCKTGRLSSVMERGFPSRLWVLVAEDGPEAAYLARAQAPAASPEIPPESPPEAPEAPEEAPQEAPEAPEEAPQEAPQVPRDPYAYLRDSMLNDSTQAAPPPVDPVEAAPGVAEAIAKGTEPGGLRGSPEFWLGVVKAISYDDWQRLRGAWDLWAEIAAEEIEIGGLRKLILYGVPALAWGPRVVDWIVDRFPSVRAFFEKVKPAAAPAPSPEPAAAPAA